MSDRFIIRSPENDDEWAAVKTMLAAYWDEFEDKTCFTSFEDEMHHIQLLYTDPGKCKLIAIDTVSNGVVGCVALRGYGRGMAEMKRLYVIPKYRGYQLGKALAEAIIQKGAARGYTSMMLDTMMEMKAAQNLYVNLGFHQIPPYNQQDETKIICYEKILTV
jgi:putative acetyltransferase